MAQVYTIPQFCEAYRLSRSTLYRLWGLGLGPRVIRVGRKVLIPTAMAEAWLKSLEAPAVEAHGATLRRMQ